MGESVRLLGLLNVIMFLLSTYSTYYKTCYIYFFSILNIEKDDLSNTKNIYLEIKFIDRNQKDDKIAWGLDGMFLSLHSRFV